MCFYIVWLLAWDNLLINFCRFYILDSWSKCPLAVARDFCKCLLINCVVNPDQDTTYVCLIDLSRVELAGPSSDADRYCAISFFVWLCLIIPLAIVICVGNVGVYSLVRGWWSRTSHKLLLFRLLLMMTLLFFKIFR